MIESHEDSLFQSICGMSVSEMRYYEVQRRLDARGVKEIIDMGCSEGLFIQRLSRSEVYTRLVGVDLDEQLLKSVSYWNVQPQAFQNNIKYSREAPLLVELFQGDILQEDAPLKQLVDDNGRKNVPTAITLIEVIEHLQLSQVPALSKQLFGYYRPQWAVITTPNTDFNFYFGREGSKKLRHWDHKFQWNRQQFDHYCQEVCSTYGYSYELFGVGYPKGGERQRGACTQGAIFTRTDKEEKAKELTQQGKEVFKKILSCPFPYWRDCLQKDIMLAVAESIRSKSFYNGLYIEQDEFQGYPLSDLLTDRETQLLAKADLPLEKALSWIAESKECLVTAPDLVRYNNKLLEQQIQQEQQQRRLQQEQLLQASEE